MSLLQKARHYVKRCGAPAKFVAKLVVGSLVPGPVADLVEKVIDCAFDTAKDNLGTLAANTADQKQLEQMFDLLLGDLQGIVDRLLPLEETPELARETLRTA